MSDQKPALKPDDLTKPTHSETIELTEEELKRLSGGSTTQNKAAANKGF